MKLWHLILAMAVGVTMIAFGTANIIEVGMKEYGETIHLQVCNGEMTKTEAAVELKNAPFTDIAVEGYKSMDCSDVRKLVDEL